MRFIQPHLVHHPLTHHQPLPHLTIRTFEFSYFRKRVRRHVPPPSVHYHQVRAVYMAFGNKIDSTTKQPLFNKAAWKKADNVLKEVRERERERERAGSGSGIKK